MIIICIKCAATHEVDETKIGWSSICAACLDRPWGMRERGWMREKHKQMVKKRNRVIRSAQKRRAT